VMKGYYKIGSGMIHCDKKCVADNDNYQMDSEIRTVVHSVIIGETERSGCEEFYVVVYKQKLHQQAGE
jgi:hypothetical protein